MPYDKLIDSAQLDGALSATANAIRAKRGDASPISWNATTGFASAISAISGGAKVATGTFNTNGGLLKETSKQVTVSGLGFKPTRVIFYLVCSRADAESSGINLGDSDWGYIANYREQFGDEEDEDYYELWFMGYSAKDKFKIDLLSDGFKIYATGSGSYTEIHWRGAATYRYIAIG